MTTSVLENLGGQAPPPQGSLAGLTFRPLGRLEQYDYGNMYRTDDGQLIAINPQSDVVGRDGMVYARDPHPPNQPAAQAAQGVGIFGKLASALGIPDYSGQRAGTSWRQALQNTLGSPSLANTIHGALTAADRLMTETTSTGRPDSLAAVQGLETAGTLAMTSAPGAIARGGSSAGVFGGRIHAQNLAEAGRPVALRAIEAAEALEGRGASIAQIERHVSRWIRNNDPELGPIYRDPEGWLFEIPGGSLRHVPPGPERSLMGDVLQSRLLYQASPSSENMPVLWGRAADYAAQDRTHFSDPVGRDSAQYVPHGYGHIELGRDVVRSREYTHHELQHHLSREAGLTGGSSIAVEREALRKGALLDDPVYMELWDREARASTESQRRLIREAMQARIDQVGRERYWRNRDENRALAAEDRSTFDAATAHELPPRVSLEARFPLEGQLAGAPADPLPPGPRPIAVEDVVRWLRTAGVQNIRVQQGKGAHGTTYIKFDSPDNPHVVGQGQAVPTVRVPIDEHGGRPANPYERGTLFDTGRNWREGARPRDVQAGFNEAGGAFAQWQNLLAALRWRLSRAPDGQWLISPDQAPRGLRHVQEAVEAPTGNIAPDPNQGTLPFASHGRSPMDTRSVLFSHPAIIPTIESLAKAEPRPSNLEISDAVRRRTGVYITAGQVRSYLDRAATGEARPQVALTQLPRPGRSGPVSFDIRVGDTNVGRVSVNRRDNTIADLYLDPRHQQQGLGEATYDALARVFGRRPRPAANTSQ